MKKNVIITIITISILICSFYVFYELRYNFQMTSYIKTELDKVDDSKEELKDDQKENASEKTKTIFAEYEEKAQEMLQNLSIDEKIAQLLIVRNNQKLLTDQKKYQFGGIIFFENDFKNKTRNEIIEMITTLQQDSKIPLLTASDEEGGKVSRLSSNKKIVTTPFKSSQELYNEGGFDRIKEDTIYKSMVLSSLGLNLNLAPVVDISLNKEDYIYERTIGLNATLTSIYAQTVIETSKLSNVSYTLKHFPGYGNNVDTHKGMSIDNRSYEEIMHNDILPFKAGINAGAEAIMVSHNIVTSIDEDNPSTLSKKIHDLMRNDLQFSGVIITDDLSMKALSDYDNVEVTAINAGNDLLITSDYETSFNNLKKGLENNLISEDQLDEIVQRIISWKYYKKLL